MQYPLIRRTARWSKCLALALLTALLVAPAGASGFDDPATLTLPDEPFRADVDLDDVPVDHALRLLAELYDVSLVAGQLPEARVTMRLRRVPASDAFASVALATGLAVEHQGSVVLISTRATGEGARQVVLGSLPPASSRLAWLDALGVEARRLDNEAFLLEGPREAVDAAVAALDEARLGALVDRVFPLGAASGEASLQAIRPLLAEGIEAAAYDATGHALTISARAATFGRIEALLARLTRSPTQYEIEVRVVEVSRNALRRLGSQGFARLDVRGGLLPTTFPLASLADSSRYFPSANDLAGLEDRSSTGTPVAGSVSDSGFRFGQIDGRGVGFLLEALEQSGEAEVVATPKVTTLDSRWAKISMVTTLRIPTFTQNQAFATTTVSGIEQVDVGTTLEVRPRRGKGREIILTVTPEVSELEPTAEGFTLSGLTQGLPIVTRRRTETEVILEPGETLVIGGLVREREDKTLGKTPGLGDIPWIGRAFQLKGRDFTSTELLVFVTPHELPSAEERRAKVRVDDAWLPAALGTRMQSARGLMAGDAAEQRIAGLQVLEQIDAELLTAGLDAALDAVDLGADPSLSVRVAAALFLLHRRPSAALGELVRFTDSRRVALSALAAPIAPHLRVALAELVVRSEGGVEVLEKQFRAAFSAGESAAVGRLLEASSAVVPEHAAQWAVSVPMDGLIPVAQHLDALGGVPGNEEALTQWAAQTSSTEAKVFAQAALGRVHTQASVAGLPPDSRHAVALQKPVRSTAAREPALAWSGSPSEIAIRGSGAGAARVGEALELLADKTPDLHHLVGFALSTIETDAAEDRVVPSQRRAFIAGEIEPQRLAHRLVRLAIMVFESRVRGFPATSRRSLALAVRQELRALERLTGAPCPPGEADATVERILAAAIDGSGPVDLEPSPIDSSAPHLRITDGRDTPLPIQFDRRSADASTGTY
ncbi:MAG: type II and III secretion system protein [Acidobacteriota bacterium]